MNRRRKRRLPFAAYAALIFNGALCAAPFMAAHLISSAYGDRPTAFEPTPDAIAATRAAMDQRFEQIALRDEAPRDEVWASLVRKSLEEKEMPLVRGLLLGAPAMLGGIDGDKVRARVAVADKPGDQAMIEAAVAALPAELQDEYERRARPMHESLLLASAPAEAVASATPAIATSGAGPVVEAVDDERRVEINRLGDLRQHTKTAVGWANDDNTDVHAFLLSGIGLILADPEAREGASVAMSSLRTRTQGATPFKLYLMRRLEETVPVDEVKRLLSAELHNELSYTPDSGAVVERVFRSTIDVTRLESLLAEFRILRDIAHDTSVEAAVSIVSRVKDAVDLRAAGLVARAGGERAVALEHFDGDHLLETARTVIPWSNALRLQAAGLAAVLALLGFIALSTFWKSFTRNRPVKKSAIYQMEESIAG